MIAAISEVGPVPTHNAEGQKKMMGISLSLTELQTGVRERSVPSGLDCTYKVSILKKASPGLSSNSVSHHQCSVLLWQGQGRSWHGSQAALTPFHLKGSGCSPEDSSVL